MGRVLADTGLHMLMETAVVAIMLGHTDLLSVSLVVANQPKDGITKQNFVVYDAAIKLLMAYKVEYFLEF